MLQMAEPVRSWGLVQYALYPIVFGGAFGVAVGVGTLPTPWHMIMMAPFWLLMLIIMIRLRHRSCMVCGSRQTFPVPEDPSKPLPSPGWLYPLTPTKGINWYCLEHALQAQDERLAKRSDRRD